MPIYEYRCPKCGVFDHMQKITDKPLKRCPTCKGKVSKQMSNPAFHLKGGGWYVTDYARKGAGGESASGGGKSDSSSAGDGGGESKADKKSDAKTEKSDKKAAKSEGSASAAA